MIYPWQSSNLASLWQSHQQQRLHHALLFTGQQGTGKLHFAESLAHALLCQSPQQGEACGQCSACHLLQAGSHPDLYHLQPEEDSKVIRIDQIRELISRITLTTHAGGRRIIIVNPADAMNIASSNSLLKTLEEPPPNTLILLVTARPSRLPATIRSRCQMVNFALPEQSMAEQWLQAQLEGHDAASLLKLCGGAPLRALHIASDQSLEKRSALFADLQALADGNKDPVQMATAWLKTGLNMPLYWMYSWLVDIIRCRFAAPTEQLANQDMLQDLNKLSKKVDLDRLYNMLDRVIDAIRVSETSANQQLLLESVLLYWAGLYQR